MFQLVEGCRMNPVMGTLNDWHLVTVVQKTQGDTDEEEVALLFEDALQRKEAEIEGEITMNGKGIITDKMNKRFNPNGYQLVEWLGEPYPLQEPTICYGCGPKAMPVGSMVVKCKFWDRIPNQNGFLEGEWFEKPELNIAERIVPPRRLIWLRDVLVGAVDHQHPEPGKGPANVFFQRYNHGQQNNKILVEKETIIQRIKRNGTG